MNSNKYFWMAISITVFTLVLAGCGASVSDDAIFPTGRFIKPNNPDYGLDFNEDGTFRVFTMGNTTLVSGTYSVDGDIFTEETNDGGCSSPISFKYSFDGTNLTFQYVGNPDADSCTGRRNDFNNQTYVFSDN